MRVSLLLIASVLFMPKAFSAEVKGKEKSSSASSKPVASEKPATVDQSSVQASSETVAGSKAPKNLSLSVTFPGGGSQPLANSVGARLKLDSHTYVWGSLVFSQNTDNTEDKSVFGVAGKYQKFLGAADRRARPYTSASLYIWKPGGDASKPNDKTAFGLSGALGVEVWLIPELSTFVETGLFINASHMDKSETQLGTFASAIGLNYNFEL